MMLDPANLDQQITDACNQLDRVIGKDYQTIRPVGSKDDKGVWTLTLRAKCRVCKHEVISTVKMSDAKSGQILAEYFLSRAQAHAKRHKLIIRPSRLRTL